MIFFIFVIRHFIISAHNETFYSLVERYDALKTPAPLNEKAEEDTAKRQTEAKQLVADAHDLCGSFFSSKYSYNGCLIEALTYLEQKDFSNFALALDRYAAYHGSSPFGAYFLFFAAYGYENTLQLDKAYALYDKLQNILKTIKKEDLALYHKARILYLQKKYSLAEEFFNKIVKDFPASQYRNDAARYLLLSGQTPAPVINK